MDAVTKAEILGIACRAFGTVRRVQAVSAITHQVRGGPVVFCEHGEEHDIGEDDDEDFMLPDGFSGPRTRGITVEMSTRFFLRSQAGKRYRLGQCEICRTAWVYEERGRG